MLCSRHSAHSQSGYLEGGSHTRSTRRTPAGLGDPHAHQPFPWIAWAKKTFDQPYVLPQGLPAKLTSTRSGRLSSEGVDFLSCVQASPPDFTGQSSHLFLTSGGCHVHMTVLKTPVPGLGARAPAPSTLRFAWSLWRAHSCHCPGAFRHCGVLFGLVRSILVVVAHRLLFACPMTPGRAQVSRCALLALLDTSFDPILLTTLAISRAHRWNHTHCVGLVRQPCMLLAHQCWGGAVLL